MDPDVPTDPALRVFLAGLAVVALLVTALALASASFAHGFQQGAVCGFGIGLLYINPGDWSGYTDTAPTASSTPTGPCAAPSSGRTPGRPSSAD